MVQPSVAVTSSLHRGRQVAARLRGRPGICLGIWSLLAPTIGLAEVPFRIIVEDAAHAGLPIPSPAETPVELVVSGRTSTLRSIRIVKTGQKVPPTFAGKKMANTPGFSWYLTQHYAMKAQVAKLEEKHVVELLVVAELAYPHQVRVLGREPDGIDSQRLAIVYANTMDDLNSAVRTDLGDNYRGGGGGVTLSGNQTAYNYWTSGGLLYHRRDLLLHENMHMLEMCTFGVGRTVAWFGEGITHAIAQHVYDQERKQLTVAVLDRAPPNDFYDAGLQNVADRPVSGEDFYEGRVGEPYRPGVYLLFTQFCWSDPDRLMKWRLWRDELSRGGPEDKLRRNRRLMREVFGPPEEFDRAWRAWLAQRRNSFHYASWGWEQDREALQAYGWPSAGFEYSQMNINYAPGEKVVYDPLRMDYPLAPTPALVGPLAQGGDAPAVGCLLHFRDEPERGLAGMALARARAKPTIVRTNDSGKLVLDGTKAGRPLETLELPAEWKAALQPGRDRVGLTVELGEAQESLVPVLIKGCRELIVDGAAIGLGKKTLALTNELQQAIRQHGNQVGMTLRIAKESLEITLRAGPAAATTEMRVALPVTASQRQALLSGQLALLAKDGYHRITPCLDLQRRPEPDLSQTAPLGRWRFAGDEALDRLYRAAYVLGPETPASLRQLKNTLVDACDKEPARQQAAITAHREQLPRVLNDLRAVRDSRVRGRALAALLGVTLDAGFDRDSTSLEPVLSATIRGAATAELTGTVQMQARDVRLTGPSTFQQSVRVPLGRQHVVRWAVPVAKDDPAAFLGIVSARLECLGEQFTLTAELPARCSVPRWWVIGPFDNPGGGAADIAHPIERETLDLEKTYRGRQGEAVRWRSVERDARSHPQAEFVVSLNDLYGRPTDVAAYAVAWVAADRDLEAMLGVGSEDGFVAWVNRVRVSSVLQAPRTYLCRGDQTRVRLKRGVNELLLKITLSQAGWKFSADVTDLDGRPLPGVSYPRLRP
jgi:hypothetical protein